MTEWTANTLMELRAAGVSETTMEKLFSTSLADPVIDYSEFMFRTFGVAGLYPSFPFGTNFPLGEAYADAINLAVYPTVLKFTVDMFDRMIADGVQGDLVEFGVATGAWTALMLENMEKRGSIRQTWGFDSFEGLPAPDAERDSAGWHAGQFANALDVVSYTLDIKSRPHLHLVKGWFSDSLKTPEAQAIKQIAYAKVDGDLYESAVDCLAYLKGRLSHGAVLMFDEWTHMLHLGETRAFREWVPQVPEYRFEFVGFINYRIIFRVWHR